jgi:cobalt-zinc-cadmium resistance protein CzcA
MGPIATGLGEIFMFTVTAEPSARNEEGKAYTPTDLRTIQDWIIKPQLRNIPGVIEVNTIGGYEKQFHVTPDPNKLVTFDVTLRQLMEALDLNNANVGAGYIEKNGEQFSSALPVRPRASKTC